MVKRLGDERRAARVKICGVTRVEDAQVAATAGAAMLGLNFWPGSKRFVDAELGRDLAAAARAANPEIEIVGVFVNPSDDELEIADTKAGLDWIQLHGDESAERVRGCGAKAFKAISVADASSIAYALTMPGSTLLLDTPTANYGGSGETFDWSLCDKVRAAPRPWILAGGLTPANVEAAIRLAGPDVVDVASGVETEPGIKDHQKIRAFLEAAGGQPDRVDS